MRSKADPDSDEADQVRDIRRQILSLLMESNPVSGKCRIVPRLRWSM